MGTDWVFWGTAAAVALILLAAAATAIRRGRAGKGRRAEEAPIYTSGVFSLIRKSPRESVLSRIPDLASVRSALALARGAANGTAEEYCAQWLRVAELCINSVEHGDKEGIQTYCYAVPEKCRATCGRFGGEAYVTRDQLHHHVQLIPPFHLGCGCEIKPRAAWSGNGGWSPILPVNGQYDTPDWRTVVPL